MGKQVKNNYELRTTNCELPLQSNGRAPLIVGTLHSAACLKMLEKGPQELLGKIDFLETRLDSLPSKLLPSSWPLPVIATARHPAEGGMGNLTVIQRRRLFESALPWASAIDIELRSVKQLLSTIANAKKAKRFVICSFHDFQTVPSLARLERMALHAQEVGADLFKVACMVRSDQELMRLLAFQSMMKSGLRVATMGMGEGGQLTRLLLAAAGSALSYGWLYSPQVIGQWSIKDWIKVSPIIDKLKLVARTGVEPVRQP